ncbi:hypothetical protein [Marinoscillum sp. MHG1-6]|uniref:hypothetical protein n=1 Tax=Marinoscillum sp. MHG1-6 TaxID=2959627 RepID=UPI002157C18C|nr:hypothetical protein [Marinoscillum sp. MHG1-6]
MKSLINFIILLLILSCSVAQAQDLIVLKEGTTIRSRVMEITPDLIKYKKFDNLETSPLYSIEKDKVEVVKYEDGSEDRFSPEVVKEEIISSDSRSSKICLGGGFSLFNRYNIGNALDFWRRVNGSNSEEIDQATGMFYFGFSVLNQIDERNWLGVSDNIVIAADHALWGTNLYFGGRNEMYFRAFMMNISMFYGRAFQDNGPLLLIIEPGLDIGMMNGGITLNNNAYTVSPSFGLGGHGAIGFDYMIGENFILHSRLGYRFIKMDEAHEDSSSATGYSSFYVNGTDGETVKVDWSGAFFTIGASIAFNKEIK